MIDGITGITRRRYLASTGTAATIGIAGCLGGDDASIDLAYMPIFPDLQWFVMDQEGYLVDIDVEITDHEFTDGPAIVQAYSSGDIDIAMFGILPAMTVIDRGIAAKVATANIKDPMAILTDRDYRELWEENGGDVQQSFADWEGRTGRTFTFGTFPQGSVPDLLLRYWLENNLESDPEEVVDITEIRGANAVFQAIANGEIDGASIMEPVPSRVAAENLPVQTFLNSSDILPGQPAAVTLMNDDIREDDVAVEFVRAHARATTFIEDNPARAAEIVEDGIGMPADQARVALDGPLSNFLTDPRAIESGTAIFAEMAHRNGQLDNNLQTEEIFDYSIYDAIE